MRRQQTSESAFLFRRLYAIGPRRVDACDIVGPLWHLHRGLVSDPDVVHRAPKYGGPVSQSYLMSRGYARIRGMDAVMNGQPPAAHGFVALSSRQRSQDAE